jgi:quercetin dioxygenase-like cupin family protein
MGRLIAATSVLLIAIAVAIPKAVALDIAKDRRGQNLNSILTSLPGDHPEGTRTTTTLVSSQPATRGFEARLSAYVVDFAPGGSATLRRAPARGYVMLHVLSGAVRAQAWHAQLGTYRAGETWTEPAFARDITAVNASASEPARAFVVQATSDPDVSEADKGG